MIKLLTAIEARTVTAAVRLFLDFCHGLRAHPTTPDGSPTIEASVATYIRRGARPTPTSRHAAPGHANEFVAAAREAGIEVDALTERFRFDPQVIRGLREVVKRRAP